MDEIKIQKWKDFWIEANQDVLEKIYRGPTEPNMQISISIVTGLLTGQHRKDGKILVRTRYLV